MTLQQETLFYMLHTLYAFSCWLYEYKRLVNDLLSEYLMQNAIVLANKEHVYKMQHDNNLILWLEDNKTWNK